MPGTIATTETVEVPPAALPDILAGDGHRIAVRSWPAGAEPRAAVQILHGLAEHIERYGRFAADCNARGLAVFGHNHRGHGPQADEAMLGHFADENGWSRVIADTRAVYEEIRRQYPGVPIVLFGHSMGSYVAQSFVMRDRPAIAALVLSGSTWPDKRELRPGRLLARVLKWFRGTRTKSRLFDELLFKKYNKRFAPNRTAFDWLSRDEAEVDRYVADPLCGALSSYGLWLELFDALIEIGDGGALARVPAGLPILITGGERDPVGGKRALARLAAEYEASGHERVTLKLYPDGRHEMLNEINRDEVTDDWLMWVDEAIGR